MCMNAVWIKKHSSNLSASYEKLSGRNASKLMHKDSTEHIERLRGVFQKLRVAGLNLKPSKCEFFEDRIAYLGHIVSKAGIETITGMKVQTILDSRGVAPKDNKEAIWLYTELFSVITITDSHDKIYTTSGLFFPIQPKVW